MPYLSLPTESVVVSSPVDVNLRDGLGNLITSQVNGSQQALDIGINVAGTQIDPRSIRALTTSDAVTAHQGGIWDVRLQDGAGTDLTSTLVGSKQGLDINLINSSIAVTQSGTWSVGVSNLPTTVDTDFGASGASTLRVASLIGNSSGAADFNTGNAGAQTLRVVVASNQPAIAVTQGNAATSALSGVAASASSTSVLGSNANRKGLVLVNNADKPVYISFAATSSTTAFSFKMLRDASYFMDGSSVYTGAISAVWEAGPTGSLRVTELS